MKTIKGRLKGVLWYVKAAKALVSSDQLDIFGALIEAAREYSK